MPPHAHLRLWPLLALAAVIPAMAAPPVYFAQEDSTTSAAVEAHLGKGYDALRKDQYEIAASEFKAALAEDPSLTERARFPLAVALFEMHDSEQARREFVSLRRQLGDHPNIVYYLGRLDIESGDYESAIQNLSKAVVKPPFPDTAYYLGFAYLKERKLAEAEKWLKSAARLIPQDSRVEYQLSKLYRDEGRDPEAAAALKHSEELRQRDENDVKLRLQCTQDLEHGPQDEAHAVCEKLFDPDNAEKLTSLGTIYGQHGDLQSALQCFQRAAELEPQSPQMQYNLALTYFQMNQLEKARIPLQTSLKRWPDLFQLNALYGAVLEKLGEDTVAYQALRRAHELDPQDAGTLNLLYSVTLRLATKTRQARDYSQSLRYLQEAAKARPQQAEPHQRMAEIYSLTAQETQAAAERREAERLSNRSLN